MTNLINRDPPGRLSCLHALLKSLYHRHKLDSFNGQMAKHVEGGKDNPMDFCTCAEQYDKTTALITGAAHYCPFLRAASSRSYCYLTNSNVQDSQKSKAVGEAIQALEALGLCTRTVNRLKRLKAAQLTEEGVRIAQLDFLHSAAREYYEKNVSSYGPAVGFLHLLESYNSASVEHDAISRVLGRPNNNDEVILNSGHRVRLNDGDTQDAMTRTAGALQGWLTYAGYVSPEDQIFKDSFMDSDTYFADKRNKLGYRSMQVAQEKIQAFFAQKPLVANPLSYDFYIKGLGTAREHSQRSVDGIQLENLCLKEYGDIVRNRRLLLMYTFSVAARKNMNINVVGLAKHSNYQESPFVVDSQTHEHIVVEHEIDFLVVAGAPFKRSATHSTIIIPRVMLPTEKIANSNESLVSTMRRIVEQRGVLV